ncbi:MAG TPA: gas vesicle protein K [Gemmatimonadaceae bacterium]|nr:gas vesicle protein K [Gemmatimonadaceae bacterium]
MSDDILGSGRLDLSDVLSSLLDKGVALRGGVTLAVADIDLVYLDLALLLTAIESVMQEPKRAPPLLARAFGPPDLTPGRGTAADTAVVPTPGAGAARTDSPHSASQGKGVTISDLAPGLPDRIDADASAAENGLARLVLTLIELLRKVLEHQAIRRMDGGGLTEDEVEKLGLAMLRLHKRMEDMKEVFGLADEDLQVDLGPLGRLR